MVPVFKFPYLTLSLPQLVKVPVAECSTYSNCSTCISSNNPYCGWCVLKNRCSTEEECENSNQEIHWKRGEPAQCITITSVTPTSAPANRETTVTIVVQAQLPQDEVRLGPKHEARGLDGELFMRHGVRWGVIHEARG